MKKRIDELLVDKGFFETREKAKRAIISGIVYIEGLQKIKPGNKVDIDVNIIVKNEKEIFPYVSRGGLKLKRALEEFKIIVKDKIALDIGASTGGFTDCLLQNGAKKVYAVDVGYGQLDWKLRKDPRVIVRERINARYLSKEVVKDEVDIITIDVSFISITKILPNAVSFLREKGDIIALIKPQFEVGKEDVGRGVVRDPDIHKKVLHKVIKTLNDSTIYLYGLTWSPIKGPKGNIEFLAWLKKIKNDLNIDSFVSEVVEEAHKKL